MPEPMRIAKARLEELQADLETPRSGGKRVTVQFNPESLKVNFANQIQTPQGSGGSGDSARPPASATRVSAARMSRVWSVR